MSAAGGLFRPWPFQKKNDDDPAFRLKVICVILGLVAALTILDHCLAGPKAPSVHPPQCDDSDIERYYGRYQYVGYVRFGGGLRTEEEAQAQIGQYVDLSKNVAKFPGVTIDKVRYEIGCYEVPNIEGHVQSKRWSQFYGYADTREIIRTLEVYSLDSSSEHPRFIFEIISEDELWEMSDGRLFQLRREGDAAFDVEHIRDVLREGGFSGVMDEAAEINPVGTYRYPGDEIQVIYYAREFGNRRLAQRLLLLSKLNGYLGMYAIADPPTGMVDGRIQFPYEPNLGDKISIVGGKVPDRAYLDGENPELFK